MFDGHISMQIPLKVILASFQEPIDLIEDGFSVSLLTVHVLLDELQQVTPFLNLLLLELLQLHSLQLATHSRWSLHL
jgi:hypothetical protein